MIVRVQFQEGPRIRRRAGKNRHLALAAGAMLIPAALMAYLLGLWRLGADLGLAGEFVIGGIFSHWQLWIGLGAVLQLAAYSLNRYGRSGRMAVPPLLSALPGSRSSRRSKAGA
jgi:hypothetical protein